MSTPKENWVKGYSVHSQRRATSECEHGPYAVFLQKTKSISGRPQVGFFKHFISGETAPEGHSE